VEVRIFEEHASVLPYWAERGVRGRTLIYLDAHLDLQCLSEGRMQRLRDCGDAEQLARLEKRHHLLPDGDSSYGIEDFLYAASRLGMLDRLIWVAPPHVEIAGPDAVQSELEQMDGVTPEEIASFDRSGEGVLRGRLLGLDLTICRVEDLAGLDRPHDALIDIDADYFVEVPGDRPWIDPRRVFECLEELDGEPPWISIARSVSSGYMPLWLRFVPDQLAACWQGDVEQTAHYGRVFVAAGLLAEGKGEALALLREEQRAFSACEATAYLLARAEPDPLRAQSLRARAAELDPGYGDDLLRRVSELRCRRRPIGGSEVAEFEGELARQTFEPERRALIHIGLGFVYCAAGRMRGALEHYEAGAAILGPHPELGLEIGRRLLASARPEQAVPFLEAALADDRSHSAACVALGALALRRGEYERAVGPLRDAHARAPAWREPRRLLAAVEQQLGSRPT
jgi:tetratricopeptide (TPR) repeat protein